MEQPFRIAVLASTNGTDLQAIIDEMKAGLMPGIELAAVISNKHCYALERAADQGYDTYYIEHQGRTREEFDQEVSRIVDSKKVDLIALVGYMRILSADFVKKYPNRIINVHPALVPKFSGKGCFSMNVHQAVIDAGETESGMTIQYVDEGVDTGSIIVQKSCPVTSEDTPETLKEKVQALEKKWYPEVIRQIAQSQKPQKDGI